MNRDGKTRRMPRAKRARTAGRGRAQVCALAWLAVLTLAAPARVPACEAMLAGEYSDPPELVQLDLDPAAWEVAAQIRDVTFARKDYVHAGDTLDVWNELVSWQVSFGARSWSLATLRDQLLAQIGASCQGVESRVLRDESSDVIYEWWHRGCAGDGRPQHEISRLVLGITGFHQISYSWRGSALEPEARERWLTWIQHTKLTLRGPSEARDPLERARIALWSGAYARAVELLRPLADAGRAGAQVELARLHTAGWGVPKDYALALAWFRRAAAQGDVEAEYQLGRMYESGWGVAMDLGQAAEHYDVAARGGSAEAQGHLGYLLATRSSPDFDAAARWFRRSAEQGHLHAVYWMGRLYEEGHGVERSPQEAVAWYTRAARAGSPDAQFALGRLHTLGVGVARDDRQARVWLTRAVMQGKSEARDFFLAHRAPGG